MLKSEDVVKYFKDNQPRYDDFFELDIVINPLYTSLEDNPVYLTGKALIEYVVSYLTYETLLTFKETKEIEVIIKDLNTLNKQ